MVWHGGWHNSSIFQIRNVKKDYDVTFMFDHICSVYPLYLSDCETGRMINHKTSVFKRV